MLIITDLKGNKFVGYAEVKRIRRLNGEREISLSFLSSDINNEFIYDLDFRWIITFKNEDYVVIDPKKQTSDGDNIIVDITAVKKFFVDNSDVRKYDQPQKSLTAAEYFDNLYQGTNKTCNLVDNFYAANVDLSKGQTVQERHNLGLTYYNAEQVISNDSTTVYLYNQVGRELDKVFHEDLNMSSFNIDVSSSGFHTYCRGFGKQKEDGTYITESEYLSPLAKIYGKIDGPPIEDDRFTNEESLRKACEKQVDNSFEISNSFDVTDLKYHGYTTSEINEGDFVWCVSNKLKVKLQLRINEIEETFDVEGELLDAVYTVGNEAITRAYKAQQRSALFEFTASLKGNRKLPKSVLPGAVMYYTNLLNEAKSYFQYLPTGVIGIDENNPLLLIKIKHNGMGISEDGGKSYKTAITGAGIVADVINTGVLNTNLVKIQGTEGHFWIDGDVAKWVDANNPNRYTEITPQGAYFKGGSITIETSSGRKVIMNGYLNRSQTTTLRLPSFRSSSVEVIDDWYATDSTDWSRVESEYVVHEARYFVMSAGINEWGYSMNVNARARLATISDVSNVITTYGMTNGSGYAWIKIDLGEPLDVPQSREIYYEMRTSNGAGKGRMHLGNRFLTDNLPAG